MINGHGDDIFNFPDIRMNFSSNVSPAGINPQLQGHLCSCLNSIERYPEPLAESLALLIEGKNQLPNGSVLITNGAVEAFYLIAELFRKKRSLIFYPSFSEYSDACKRAKHHIEYCHHAGFESADYSKTDLVWICNPNNPDGRIYEKDFLRTQIESNPKVIFVVDEAYVDFLDRDISLQAYLTDYPNLIIVKSLTKKFVIPGLRLGYLIASLNLVQDIKSKIMPWRINSLAIEAGKYCVLNHEDDDNEMKAWLDESRRVQSAINSIEGFSVVRSQTTFFLVQGPVRASELKKMLASDFGMLIRDASNFWGLSDRFFRISVQTPMDNNLLIKALSRWS
jgi:threonine-phosphate decarboxylase